MNLKRTGLTKTKNIKVRFFIFLFFTLLLLFILIGRYVYVMLYLPLSDKSEVNQTPRVERGPILDRNGNLLAITTTLDSVAAWIPDLDDIEATGNWLAENLSLDKESIFKKLAAHSGFVWLKRQISKEESEKILALKAEGKLKGIILEPEYGRDYPEKSLASHLIGYVGIDNTGLEGIEYSWQNELAPVTTDGQTSKIIGNQIFLTIDIHLQYLMEKIAQKAYEENQAESVMLLVLDAVNADVLAYVSLPAFDPNNFKDFAASHLLNRPLRSAYEPGSVFKIFSIASLLDLDAITPQDTFYCDGFFYDQEHNIKINCLVRHGSVNIKNIIQYSCNSGAAYASLASDSRTFYNMLRSFGFGKPTGVGLAGENPGILRTPTSWSARTKPTIAFGQEVSVSALQIMAAATVLTNQGVRLKPHIVKKIMSPEGKMLKEFTREPVEQVVSAGTARLLLEMMSSATPQLARISGINVSTKTGTAQVLDPKTGTYSREHFIASILGIFPSENPQVIAYVVINRPRGGSIHGSRIAAPVFREAAEKLISLLAITHEDTQVVKQPSQVKLKLPQPITIGATMPDLTGQPKRLLYPLFQKEEFNFIIKGEGYVFRQTPPPGTQLKGGMTIVLEFE